MAKYKKGQKHVADPLKKERQELDIKIARDNKYVKFIVLSLFVFSFLLYSNTLNHGYALDDDVVFLKNRFVQKGIDGMGDIFSHGFLYGFNNRNNQSYRPVVTAVFALEKEFFGNKPKAGHLINVLLYGISVGVLFLLLQLLFLKQPIWLPALIAALFAAHPIHTEVVANIKGRDDMLTFFFMVLSFYWLMKFILSNNIKLLYVSLVCYFVCLLTKENAVAFIAVFPLLFYFFSERDLKQSIIQALPYGVPLLLYFMLRNQVLDDVVFGEKLEVINNGLMAATTTGEMLATNFVILGKYVWLLIFPHPLSFDYSYSHFSIVGWTDFTALGSLLVYLLLGAFALWKFKSKEVLVFGVLFYLITLSITSNLLVKIGCTLGERFLFIPSLGYCLILGVLLARIVSFKPKPLLYTLIAILFVPFCLKTYSRNFEWKDNITLFEADVDAAPNSARTHFSLGSALNTNSEAEADPAKKKVLLERAIKELHETLKIYPEFTAAWYNMGVAYYSYGDYDNSRKSYEQAIELNPNEKQALNNLGVIYFNQREYNKALEYFTQATVADPSFIDPYANIGAVHHNTGNYDQAIVHYNKVLALQPDNRGVINNLSKLYGTMGDQEKSNYYSKLLGR